MEAPFRILDMRGKAGDLKKPAQADLRGRHNAS